MTIKYGCRADERKRLVRAISEYMETFPEYASAPTCNYTISYITVDRNGTVISDRDENDEETQGMIEYLASKGYEPVPEVTDEETVSPSGTYLPEVVPADDEEQSPTALENEDSDLLTIEIPKNGFTEGNLTNLRKIVESKASLLKKSLGTDDLSIEISDDIIRFPWFHPNNELESEIYSRLVTAICDMAKHTKQITGKDHPVDSEKYAFRTWLLRLGYNGPEYKNDRAVLMKNLSGFAAFKNQAEADKFRERHMTAV